MVFILKLCTEGLQFPDKYVHVNLWPSQQLSLQVIIAKTFSDHMQISLMFYI